MPAQQPITTGSSNNVVINVSVQNASDDEALRFAKKVKKYLDNGSSIAMMGSN